MVVLWHIDVFNMPWINALWMPMFFVVSGMFFKETDGMKLFIEKKVNGIFIPFVSFYLLSYFFFYICNWIMPGVIKTSAGGILDVFTQRQYFNGPIWFLLSLFNVSLLMFLISSTSQREWGRCLYVCLFGLFGYFLDQADVMFPLMIDTSFTMLPFFYVGVLVKRYSLHKYLRGGYLHYVIWSILFVAGIAVMIIFDYPELHARDNHYIGNVFVSNMFYLCTIGFLLCVFAKTPHIPFLTYFGRYSLIPLCLHHLVYRPVILFERIMLDKEDQIITAIVTILICLAAIPFCNKYLPWIVGQKTVLQLNWNQKDNVEICD